MGRQLETYYGQAEKLGLMAKMKLAMLTRIPSTKAAETPDTPDVIQRFQDAMVQINAEFGK